MPTPQNSSLAGRRIVRVALLVLSLVATLSPPVAAAPLRAGTWTKVTASTEGGWRLLEEGGRLVLELDAAFRTKSAPDLVLYLSPRPVAELDGSNVTENALRIAALASAKGAQRYELPAGTDLARYRSLALHCVEYSKLWAKAPL